MRRAQGFTPQAVWMPPKGRDASLEAYIVGIQTNIEMQLERLQASRSKDNLSSEERMVLQSLRKRSDIIIKPEDKGSAVVVLSRADYIKEADRQLSNELHYQKLSADPTTHHTTKIKEFVHLMFSKGSIDKKSRDS